MQEKILGYKVEGDTISEFLLLLRCITELLGIRTYNNLPRRDESLTCSKMKEVEPSARTLLEATLWMDWWLFSAWSLVMANSEEVV